MDVAAAAARGQLQARERVDADGVGRQAAHVADDLLAAVAREAAQALAEGLDVTRRERVVDDEPAGQGGPSRSVATDVAIRRSRTAALIGSMKRPRIGATVLRYA